MKAYKYFSVGLGLGFIGASIAYKTSWVYNQYRFLKRKLRRLEHKMCESFDKLDEESLKKYQEGVLKKYNEIKNKIESITIKDIKEKSLESFNAIKEGLDNFAQSLNDLASSS